jgi:hypothetical protein
VKLAHLPLRFSDLAVLLRFSADAMLLMSQLVPHSIVRDTILMPGGCKRVSIVYRTIWPFKLFE